MRHTSKVFIITNAENAKLEELSKKRGIAVSTNTSDTFSGEIQKAKDALAEIVRLSEGSMDTLDNLVELLCKGNVRDGIKEYDKAFKDCDKFLAAFEYYNKALGKGLNILKRLCRKPPVLVYSDDEIVKEVIDALTPEHTMSVVYEDGNICLRFTQIDKESKARISSYVLLAADADIRMLPVYEDYIATLCKDIVEELPTIF